MKKTRKSDLQESAHFGLFAFEFSKPLKASRGLKSKPLSLVKLPKIPQEKVNSTKKKILITSCIKSLSSKDIIEKITEKKNQNKLLAPIYAKQGDFINTKNPLNIIDSKSNDTMQENPQVQLDPINSLRLSFITSVSDNKNYDRIERPKSISSYGSSELEKDLSEDTKQESDDLSAKKFNSPSISGQSAIIKRNESSISIQSLNRNTTTEDSFNGINSKSSLLESIKDTSSLTVYNHLKYKLISPESVFEEVNGGLFKWKAIEITGNGGFGQVLKAMNLTTGKIFAVKKFFFNQENSTQKEIIELLTAEVKILEKLKHNHIVKYLGSEIINDNNYIYMEFLSGGSLSDLINKTGALLEITVKNLIKQVLKGLNYLHENDIIHRDLKSNNLLLSCDGKIKICDFGCSKKYENEVEESGFVTSFKGTLAWMAPEVLEQKGYGRKADIWSLGCVVVEMITGKALCDEMNSTSHTQAALGYKIPDVPKEVSKSCKDFVSKCLNIDPTERGSASDLLKHEFLKL